MAPYNTFTEAYDTLMALYKTFAGLYYMVDIQNRGGGPPILEDADSNQNGCAFMGSYNIFTGPYNTLRVEDNGTIQTTW